MDHIVIDVEVQNPIEDVPGGWNATDKLGLAVACVWEYQTQRMRVYGPNNLTALRNRILRADRVSGYNIWRFDFPVIWGLADRGRVDGDEFLRSLLPKTNDLLMRIWEAQGLSGDSLDFSDLHKGWSLDNVALGTLGVGKIGNGADAPNLFQSGQLHQLINYCCDDVALERDLTDFIDRYDYVINNKTRQILIIPPCSAWIWGEPRPNKS